MADKTNPCDTPDPTDFIAVAEHLRAIRDADEGSLVPAAEQLGIKKRKAYYMLELADALPHIDAPRERLLAIGWTKLQIVAPHITSGDAEHLLAAAEEHTVPVLKKIVAGREPPERTHIMMFVLDDAQHEIARQALLAHGATRSSRGLHGKEAALVAALELSKRSDAAERTGE